MLGSKSARYDWQGELRLGLLSGCFVTLVSTIVGGVFWFAGLFTPSPISTMLYWLLAIFILSSAEAFLAILDFESFLEP